MHITNVITQFFSRLPTCTLHNHYGPTESHVVTTLTLPRAVSDWIKLPPIGRPIANTLIYILDNFIEPVPVGVHGELHIGGACLARGYLNRPELTQEKFIFNPFSNNPNARLYKTGDLARYLPDGNIEYLGRLDNQVKIRGFRIELSEIEVQLAQHPSVQDSVVIIHEVSPYDKRLVAYLVPNPQKIIEQTELHHFLKNKLPDYMVPSVFVQIDAIPLTPNGKVDRRTLSQLSVTSYQLSEKAFVAPRTPEEELLAGIWATVLDVEKVGIFDNFFELGGHSLLATVVISRIRDTLAIELSLRHLFESPTIACLCEHLSQERRSESLPPITSINREETLPLSFAQQRLWFLDQLEGKNATYNMPAAVRLEGALNLTAIEQSLTKIVQRHETLSTTFPTVNGKPVVRLGEFSYQLSIINLQDLSEDVLASLVPKLVNEEARFPFDLSLGPLFRTTLLQLNRELHVLLVNMHHIISDDWSIGILIQELSTFYEAFSQGQASPLPELNIQYVDFAAWQRQWLTGAWLDKQLNYWKQQLADAPPYLNCQLTIRVPQFNVFEVVPNTYN